MKPLIAALAASSWRRPPSPAPGADDARWASGSTFDDKTGEAKVADPHRRGGRRAAPARIEKMHRQGCKPNERLRGVQRRAQGQADRRHGDHPRRQGGARARTSGKAARSSTRRTARTTSVELDPDRQAATSSRCAATLGMPMLWPHADLESACASEAAPSSGTRHGKAVTMNPDSNVQARSPCSAPA